MAEINSPGYIEAVGSSKRKTKEDLRINQIVPSEILEASGDTGIKLLLEKYYEFMNLNEFIYDETETHTDLVLDGIARFRIPDPNNENNKFFTDEQGNSSTLTVNGTTITLNSTNVAISNGNELPGSLKESTSEIGKTLTVSGLSAYNGKIATLTTPVKNWVGPGPSYVLNAIEDFMDIDKNSDSEMDATHQYLEMMQKEIASAIPRGLLVNKNTLYKRIVDFYKIRGSSDSIETFFRLLYNEEVEIEKPYDNTLIPSSGNWSADTNQFISTKGFVSEKKIRLHDSYRYQKYSYLIKTGKNLTDWEYTFNRLVHPAGFIFFGEILLLIQMLRTDRLAHQNFLQNGTGSPSKGVTVSTKNPETGDLVQQLVNVYGKAESIISSMPGIQPGIIGAEDIPVLIQMFVSSFGPTPTAAISRNAILSASVSSGSISSIEIANTGHGYSTAPTLTITGDGSNATATCTINSVGEVESVTITNAGSGYTEASITASAPSIGVGKVADIRVPTFTNNVYRTPPQIILGAPTAVDENGDLLGTNVQATAEFTLEPVGLDTIRVAVGGSNFTSEPDVIIAVPNTGSDRATARATINELGEVDGIFLTHPGSGYTALPQIQIVNGGGTGATAEATLLPSEITGINITNNGNGYVVDPSAKLSSSTVSERRARETGLKLKLAIGDAITNNYFSLKGNSYYNSTKRFDLNQPIEQFGDQSIQSTDTDSINRYNINSFINVL